MMHPHGQQVAHPTGSIVIVDEQNIVGDSEHSAVFFVQVGDDAVGRDLTSPVPRQRRSPGQLDDSVVDEHGAGPACPAEKGIPRNEIISSLLAFLKCGIGFVRPADDSIRVGLERLL